MCVHPLLTRDTAKVVVPSFYNIISNDEDILKIVVQVMNGMSASAAELQKYLSYWDKYKYIWENDKVLYEKFFFFHYERALSIRKDFECRKLISKGVEGKI